MSNEKHVRFYKIYLLDGASEEVLHVTHTFAADEEEVLLKIGGEIRDISKAKKLKLRDLTVIKQDLGSVK